MTCGPFKVPTLSLSSGFQYVLSTGDSMYETPARSGALKYPVL